MWSGGACPAGTAPVSVITARARSTPAFFTLLNSATRSTSSGNISKWTVSAMARGRWWAVVVQGCWCKLSRAVSYESTWCAVGRARPVPESEIDAGPGVAARASGAPYTQCQRTPALGLPVCFAEPGAAAHVL